MSDERHDSDSDDVILVARKPQAGRVCWYCGSEDLVKGVEVGTDGGGGSVGIKFRSSGQFLGMSALGTEPILATLCRECGTVVRLYVKSPDLDWR